MADIKRPYLYTGAVALAANAVGQIPFQITADFDYFLTGFTYNSTVSNANDIPYFSIQLQSNEDRIFSDWIPARVFAGMTAELSTAPDTRYPVGLANWFMFDCPYPFPQKATMIWNLRNDLATAHAITIVTKGYRVYPRR